jgi:hypothetical protein
MKIEIIGEVNGSEINEQELLSYVSQIVLSKVDKTITKKNTLIKLNKQNLIKKKVELKEMKKELDAVEKEYAHAFQLSKVISLLASLKKEGVIRGALKPNIINLLNNIKKLDFYKLRDIEQRLSIHLPDKYSK